MNKFYNNLSGIYCITNLVNGKKYIGSTSTFRTRFSGHLRNLINNKASTHLQNSWNKYGRDNFVIEPIIICEKEDLLFYEQLCINKFKTYDPKYGYNIAKIAGSTLGIKHSQKTKDKIAIKSYR